MQSYVNDMQTYTSQGHWEPDYKQNSLSGHAYKKSQLTQKVGEPGK